MTDRTIFISREFSQFPGPRYEVHGPDSGELFRINILAPALTKAIEDSSIVTVVLDEVAGYGSSFLDEAFAGLLRNGFSYENVMSHLRIEARTNRFQHHKVTALKYIEEERKRQAKASTSQVMHS